MGYRRRKPHYRGAGGVISDFGGGDEYLSTGNIIAGNRAIHAALLKEVQAVFAGIIDK